LKHLISISMFALGALSCSEARVFGDDGSSDGTASALGATEHEVSLRTAERGLYVVAELGGGGVVNANREGRGPWETFTLRDLNGGEVKSGDVVAFRTHDGHWLTAEGGGGSKLIARGEGPHAWEKFVIDRLDEERVTLETENGHYLVAEGGGGSVVNADREAAGAWETFVLELHGRAAPGLGDGVRPEDVVLLPPETSGPTLGTVTGYEMNTHCPFAGDRCERPLYLKYDRDDPEWWDTLVQELLASRVNVVMAHGRGCYDASSGDSGNGNMCPRLLRHLIAAIDRAGAHDVLRLGMFDDTGAYQGTRTAVDGLPESARFDLGDRSSWRFFWDHNMRIWFDTVPRHLWYRRDGRPVVAFWTLSSYFFMNQRGNASALLKDLRQKFQQRYGEDPLFIVDSEWINTDPTITTAEAQGVNDWFDPSRAVYTYKSWGGAKWGASVPGFRDPDNLPGCGAACRERVRRNGATFREAMQAGRDSRLTLLEGWTDVAESAGYYRSDAWDYPNQYINLVREFADPQLRTLKLEAEGADSYVDFSPENRGGAFRGGPADIARLREPAGWYVGWTEAGESLTFRETVLPCGTWRVTARVAAASAGKSLHVELGGQSLPSVEVPGGGAFGFVHLGEVRLPATRDDLSVVFDSGGVELDWVFLKRARSCE
jgi:hypothetical protein